MKNKKKTTIIIVATGIILVITGFIVYYTCYHRWDDATCTKPKTCSICGKTEGEALGHQWMDATCTEPQICSVCKETKGKALGHKADTWSTIKEATCTEAGEKEATCKRCGKSLVEEIPMMEHTPGEWKITKDYKINRDGTVTPGTQAIQCTVCNKELETKAFLLENVRGLYTHDGGRTFETIIGKLHNLGYGTYDLLLNSSDFGVPQNRVRLYILGIKNDTPIMSLITNLGAADSHSFKKEYEQLSLFSKEEISKKTTVKDILEENVPQKYFCSQEFEEQLKSVVGDDLSKLHGYRLIDYRGGKSLHSWELGKKGKCSNQEIKFMNLLIQNRRKPIFGRHQDGKKLTVEQIKTFYTDEDILDVIDSLIKKGYLKEEGGKYNPVCGNMSFEVFKFLDPNSISITLTSSDSNRLGIIQNNKPRRITPRECARLQGFPDTFTVNPVDNFAYKQFGNSVSVPVIQALVEDFLKYNLDKLNWN